MVPEPPSDGDQPRDAARPLDQPGLNARKTHCKNGHPFEGANLVVVVNRDGRKARVCRECRRAWQREYKRARRAARGYTRGPRRKR